jgi:hypothetical protein
MIDPSVNERVDAYRGNPQGLMQKYSQNANLIDLLALQKLKDEKTAAIREMQLKMAQNGTPPTIGQQREQEVLALTKDEIAKQQSDLTSQGQQQQVQQMQQVIGKGITQQAPAQQAPAQQGGLPSMPAPNVMPPKAMAAGGIVHFDGRSGSSVGAPGTSMPRIDPEAQTQRDLARVREQLPPSLEQVRARIGRKLAMGQPLTEQEQNIASRLNITAQDAGGVAADAGMSGIPLREGIGTLPSVMPPEAAPAAAAPDAIPANAPAAVKAAPAAPRPAPPRQAAPPVGIATPRPPAAEPSYIPAEAKPLFNAAQTQMLGELSRDPEADRARYMAEREAAIGKPTMESIAAKQARVDAVRAQDEAANRRDRDNQLTEFLLGARGTTLGESLRTAGLAGLNAERTSAANQRARALEHDKMLTELDAARLSDKEASFTGGRAAAEKTRGDISLAVKEAGLASNKLLEANIHKLDRDSQERVAALNRTSNERIAGMQVEAQKQTNLITNAQRREQYVEQLRLRAKRDGLKPLEDQIAVYEELRATSPLNAEQVKSLKAIKDLITLKEKEINSFYDNLADQSYSSAGITKGTDGKYIVESITPPTKPTK